MTLPPRHGQLIVVCGLPGSGKTSLAKRLKELKNGVRLNPDDWMSALGVNLHNEGFRAKVEALQWTFGKQLLAFGLTVIVEWGTWGQGERDMLRTDARLLGATVELHYLRAPADILFERIQRRDAEDPPIRREDLDKWFQLFEVPTDEELGLFDLVVFHEAGAP